MFSLLSLVIAGEGKDAYGDARATFLPARHSRATFVRGLRVVEDKWWSEGSGYVTRGDGSRTVEIGWRTAVEDVIHVQELARYFH